MLKKMQVALLAGISYMLPFLVIGGMTIATTGIVLEYSANEGGWATLLQNFAWQIMGISPAIFAAYTAYTLAGRLAIAPGFIGGYIANHPINSDFAESGFLGAIVAGLLAGYLVLLGQKIKVPSLLIAIRDTLFIPLLVSWLVYFIIGYPIANSIGIVNEFVVAKVIVLSENPYYAVLIGALLSALCATDMGGPLNKLALMSVFALWSEPSGVGFLLNAALFPGLMTPGISTGLAALLVKGKFNTEEQNNAIMTLISGLIGVPEMTLPYVFRDPLGTIIPNVIGSGIGGAIMTKNRVSTAGVSGILGIPMSSNILLFLFSICVSVAISLILQLILRKPIPQLQLDEKKR